MSGLLVGASTVLVDGDLTSPDVGALWGIAADERVTYLVPAPRS